MFKYIIYQIKDIEACDYAFRDYDPKKFNFRDYDKVYDHLYWLIVPLYKTLHLY